MQALVAKDKEPITPLLHKVKATNDGRTPIAVHVYLVTTHKIVAINCTRRQCGSSPDPYVLLVWCRRVYGTKVVTFTL